MPRDDTMRRALEVRFAPTVDADAGTFTGYASVFGHADDYGDTIAPGAFRRTLDEHRAAGTMPVMLWSHDPWDPVGVWEALEEDETGLRVRGRLTLDATRGRDAHALLKSRALNGLSIGFRAREFERKGKGRLLTDVELVEISLVAIPAASRARVHEVRGDHAASAAQPKGQDMEKEAMTDAAPDETRGTDTDPLEARMGEVTSTLTEIRTAVDGMGKRMDKIEARSSRSGVSAPANDGPSLETRAFDLFLRHGRERLAADETRSLRLADDTSGGYLATPDFRATLLKGIEDVSPIRRLSTVTSTSAAEIVLPKLTTRPTAAWVSEIGDRGSSEPAFGQVRIPVHEASVYVDVSTQLLEDAAVNVAAELSTMLATEYSRLEGVAFLEGDGIGKPHGVLSHDDLVTVANGHVSTLSADKLIELLYKLKPAYRARGSWIMHPSTVAAVRKLKASDGHYLWTDSLAAGQPATFLGYPVAESTDVSEIASGKIVALFGDWRAAYRVVQRTSVSLLRDPYSVATSGLTRFHSRMRVGGALVMPEAVIGLKMVSS